MHSRTSLFEELSRYTGRATDDKAEHAFNVAIRFMDHLRRQFPDDASYDLVMKAWFRAIKDDDFSKFLRIYRKYDRQR